MWIGITYARSILLRSYIARASRGKPTPRLPFGDCSHVFSRAPWRSHVFLCNHTRGWCPWHCVWGGARKLPEGRTLLARRTASRYIICQTLSSASSQLHARISQIFLFFCWQLRPMTREAPTMSPADLTNAPRTDIESLEAHGTRRWTSRLRAASAPLASCLPPISEVLGNLNFLAIAISALLLYIFCKIYAFALVLV